MQTEGVGNNGGSGIVAQSPPSVYGQQQQQQQQLLVQPQISSTKSPASTAATGTATTNKVLLNGGRFDFDDGGTYCGGWEDGKAHGHGVCTGPKGQGAYSGSWHYGFEVSGVYMWPSGNTYEGQWQNGKRHGLGVESRGRWLYRGEWTQGFKGRYGVRQSTTTKAKFEGTWANGLQDGYGSETYADGGTYQGQWMRGMRHGYGVRTSAPFGMASHSKPIKNDTRTSLSSLGSVELHNKALSGNASDDAVIGSEGRDKKLDDTRGGFVLKANSEDLPQSRKTLVSKSTHNLKRTFMSGFKMRKQRSTGELDKRVTSSIRSTASCTSWISTGSSQSVMGESNNTDSNASFIVEDEHMDVNTTETYVGEWKNDKRTGYGIVERTDGLKYEGEWFANKKYGYGVTTFKDGTKEEGKYKNNVLVSSQKKKHMFLIRSAKLKERIDSAVNAAHRASKIALQKADIAISRTATARGKAEQSDVAADHARDDFELAKLTAKRFAPDFIQPGLEKGRLREIMKHQLEQNAMQSQPVPTQYSAGMASAPNAVGASSLSMSTSNLQYGGGGGSGSGQQSFDFKDAAETTPQFKPRSHYAQPYYQSLGNNQQQMMGGSGGQMYGRNSLTPETRKPSIGDQYNSHPQQQQYGFGAGNTSAGPPPPLPPSSRMSNIANDQYPSASYQQNPMYGGGGPRRSFGQNGSVRQQPGRQSLIDRSSSYAANNYRNDDGAGAGPQYYDNGTRFNRSHNQFDSGGAEDETDPSLLRRNTKYVNRESMYSFQQAMSDHFDHYKRPPSRDSSVDRYSRAASRLSGGSRQSSVEKSQQQQQQQHQQQQQLQQQQHRKGGGDDTQSSSSSNNKSYGGGAGAWQNISSTANVKNPPPFEEIILRQRNLGQEIVPSPVGQPKRTESLYVNPNAARKDTKPRVSTTIRSKSCSGDSSGDFYVVHGRNKSSGSRGRSFSSGSYGRGYSSGTHGRGFCCGGRGGSRKPRLLPPSPSVKSRRGFV